MPSPLMSPATATDTRLDADLGGEPGELYDGAAEYCSDLGVVVGRNDHVVEAIPIHVTRGDVGSETGAVQRLPLAETGVAEAGGVDRRSQAGCAAEQHVYAASIADRNAVARHPDHDVVEAVAVDVAGVAHGRAAKGAVAMGEELRHARPVEVDRRAETARLAVDDVRQAGAVAVGGMARRSDDEVVEAVAVHVAG